MKKPLSELLEKAREIPEDKLEAVLKMIFPGLEGKSEIGEFVMCSNLGNPHSIYLRMNGSVGNTPVSVYARKYLQTPSSYKGEIPPSAKAYESYTFLRDEANLKEMVPNAHYDPKLPDWLFVEFIDGKTLENILQEKSEPERVKYIKEKILSAISIYQHESSVAGAKIPEAERRKKFWSRDVESQAEDYLSELFPSMNIDILLKCIYIPLFGKALRGNAIDHGDLSPANIIIGKRVGGEESIFLIDHELKERSEFASLGSLLAYMGDYEKNWTDFIEKFKELKAGKVAEKEGLKPIFGSWTIKKDSKRASYFEALANIFHYSLRICAKRIKQHSDDFSLQDSNLNYILKLITDKPSDYDMDSNNLKKAEILRECFEKKDSNLAEKRCKDCGIDITMCCPKKEDRGLEKDISHNPERKGNLSDLSCTFVG